MMHTINFTGSSGQQLTIVLTTEEYERGLARAQQGANRNVSESPADTRQILREIGDPCDPDGFLNPNTPDPMDRLNG